MTVLIKTRRTKSKAKPTRKAKSPIRIVNARDSALVNDVRMIGLGKKRKVLTVFERLLQRETPKK